MSHSRNNSLPLSRRSFACGAAAFGLGAAGLTTGLPRAAGAAGPVVRRDAVAEQQSPGSFAALEAAVTEMQARSQRDPNDPKGWLRNADAHRDFCAAPGVGGASQIHFCWWFLSWHRAYIAVTERKLREIANDQSIAFPYWNWSSERSIPKAFDRAGNPLSQAKRAVPLREVGDGEVDYFPDIPDAKKLGVAALGATHFEAKLAADIPDSFGGIARPNGGNVYGNSRLEGVPHGPIHNYVGGDMADFATAARDPIFFAHHGNLDRLWEIWRQDGTHRASEPTTKAFLDHVFPFTWLDGTPVTVSVAETLDTRKLGYTYDSLSVFRPALTGMQVADGNNAGVLPPVASRVLSLPAVPLTAATTKPRVVLSIEGIEKPSQAMTVGVFLKSSTDTSAGPGIAVGSFAAVKSGGEVELGTTDLHLDITAVVPRLGSAPFTVSLHPFDIARDGPYAPLVYRDIRVIAAP